MKKIHLSYFLLAGIALSFLLFNRCKTRLPSKPNVLVIISDDHFADGLGAYGHPDLQTPSLDRLAERGLILDNAYVFGSKTAAVCAPARTQIMSGKNMYHWNQDQVASNNPALWSFPRTMKENGYITYRTGKGNNVAANLNAEFQNNYEHSRIPIETHIDSSIAFLNRVAGRDPFFLFIAPRIPHGPYPRTTETEALYDPATIEMRPNYQEMHPFFGVEGLDRHKNGAPEEKVREILAKYYASITHLDNEIARLLEALEKTGEMDNTIIVFAGDNGYNIGNHGLWAKDDLYEFGGMHIPMIFAGPGIKKLRTSGFVYLMDIFPTICDLSGITIPSGVDGVSLVPVLKGKKERIREYLFLSNRNSQRSIRDDRWKIIFYPDIGKVQLFDLENDPWEMNNLSTNPELQPVISRLIGVMLQTQKEVGDSLNLKLVKVEAN